jgi:class 3 adenylate cyclase
VPDLPSATVTFLCTDIEGSTALWERDRTAMAAPVERHLDLLDHAIASQNRARFKTIGDAVQAAFPTAPEAVATAVEGQALPLEAAVAEAVALAEKLEGETR